MIKAVKTVKPTKFKIRNSSPIKIVGRSNSTLLLESGGEMFCDIWSN